MIFKGLSVCLSVCLSADRGCIFLLLVGIYQICLSVCLSVCPSGLYTFVYIRSEDEVVRLKQEISGHSSSCVELETELVSNRDKAAELLTHSEKMATRNAELQSEMSALEIKVRYLTNFNNNSII